MRNFFSRSVLVAILLVVALWSLWPPEAKLRLGKDLSGGVTLVYSVQIAPTDNPEEVMSGLIEVLKARIDPTNQLDISMVAQGRDRLEITMPLPSERVNSLRRQFEQELANLVTTVLTPDGLHRLVRLEPEQRRQEIQRIAEGSEQRAQLLQDAAGTYDEWSAALEAFRRAEDAGADEAELDRLAIEAARLERRYAEASDRVLARIISPEEVRQALLLPREAIQKRDAETGELIRWPSPREEAITRLREGQPPEVLERLERVIQAWDTYEAERRTLDDPEDLKRLLRGAGVLEFRITVAPDEHPEEARLRAELQEDGPRNVRATDVRWFRINRPENWFDTAQDGQFMRENPAEFFRGRGYVAESYDGEFFMLCWNVRGKRLTRAEGNWAVVNARQGVDTLGRPAIDFVMDTIGASLLGELTGAHINENMAVLMDDEIYTAPVLRGRITRHGQISGDFSPPERQYLIRTLNAGSLQARLSPEPISVDTVAPTFGMDHLRSGLRAGQIALVIVAGFMLVYYFPTCGGIAVFSLICNGLLLLGAMSLNRAAFTLPGIAGVILTFGMAVDANVLIYERIREELRRGVDLRTAMRLGYQRALSAIVDGNVTNLIVCVVLAYTGTQEIKGFAITLGIGVVTTMISVLIIGRLVFDVLVEGFKWRKVSMLPLAVPAIERALTPNINWLGLRYVFIFISGGALLLGFGMIARQGAEMLDLEFRGGTQVTLTFGLEDEQDPAGPRKTLTRAEVEERVRALADTPGLEGLRAPLVLPLNPLPDQVTSDTFTIKTLATESSLVVDNIARAFDDVLDTQPPLIAADLGIDNVREAPVFPITQRSLGANVPPIDSVLDVNAFRGGAAILIRDISPPPAREALESRIRLMREQPDFTRTLGRRAQLVVIDGTDQAVSSAVLLVADDTLSFYDHPESWWSDVAAVEWRLVREALNRPAELASVQSFSPAIAETFRAQAIVAVLLSFLLLSIYIWVRFGSLRYSMAAFACLLHDVIAVIGLIAVAEILWEFPAIQSLIAPLGIRPFKIDLSLVAAVMTIIGYSLNDTIVIMDRVRENRGKLDYATADVINGAINAVISRTVITSGTTLIAVFILFNWGGEGVRAFSYALLCGIIVGTYSSIAIAAPLVWARAKDRSLQRAAEAEQTPPAA